MNKIYKVKWSAHAQSYVACSELTKSQGKANKVLVNAMLAGLACLGGVNAANAAECTFTGTLPNQTYNTSATCEITPQTITGTVGWQSKLLARDGANCHDPCGSPWMMEDTGGVRASAGRGRSIL